MRNKLCFETNSKDSFPIPIKLAPRFVAKTSTREYRMMKRTLSKQTLYAISVVSLSFFACKKVKVGNGVHTGSADASPEAFDEAAYKDEDRIMNPDFGREISPPDSPSTMMVIESSETDARVIDINLSLNVWGVGSDSTTTTNLRITYTPGLTLQKHTPKGDNLILDGDGKMVWHSDNRTLAQCNYDAMVTSTATGRGSLAANPKIPFIGAGAGTTVSFEKEVEEMSLISGSSNMFPVRKGEEVDTLQALCTKYFDAAQKDAIAAQLKTIVEKKIVMDEREGFEKVMKEAAGGPKDLITNVNGLDFNVDDVLAQVKNGGKNVTGAIKGATTSAVDTTKSITGLGLTTSALPERSGGFDLCFNIQMDVDNTILTEKYDDCKGGSVDPSNEDVKHAIQIAQEIGMGAGQRMFKASDF